ncbi:acyl-CoA dehydratase activase [Thermincola potens]|uniref:CoA-substrate-specific enzyme activase n=1 Tax=Thermincola potens (strain JR) TaxID=635013 RepID=D5XBH7_THEPJ|nr:acyl-CoA dehydratase activase [Thermincola potens]ADG83406.1 CoA-substrate-specific enzyme activase [Thermincola potens JR]
MIFGFDLGSRYVKLATLAEDSFNFYRYETIEFYKEFGRKEQDQDSLVIDFARLGFGETGKIISTGYGRNTVQIQGGQDIPEIKAHVYGARWQTGLEDFTLLDLGGQDSKVVLVRKGRLLDFQTNDKCAASSGRYLENMAAVLGITLEELSKYHEDPVDLSSTCAIFGESEIIGKIIEGHSIASLAAGVNYTIFKRIKPMLSQLLCDKIIFTGGVAHNGALKNIVEKEMQVEVIVPQYPQYNGAIGCCVYGGSLLE